MLVEVGREFVVPLDHARAGGEKITVFAREVYESGGEDRPYLVFLQGGPGHESPRPAADPVGPGWLGRALRDFRVLLLDQRGTGRSSPVGVTVPSADVLALYRADSIVADCEWIRRELGVQRWSVLGQSFGGLCVTSYLSKAPEGLASAFITGGLPALGHSIDEVYQETYAIQLERNRLFYERHPMDRERVLALLETAPSLRLPSGDAVTAHRVRTMGNPFGFSDGFDTVHHLLELPFDSPAFRHDFEALTRFSRNPLYAVLQEACWADGGSTRWAAERVMPVEFREQPELLLGEHFLPSLFQDQAGLRPFAAVAAELAEREWGRLYDLDVLAANEVPVAAAIYLDDPYVPRLFSEEAASMIRGLRAWKTNEFLHNGLRAAGDRILDRLFEMVRS